MTAATMTLAEFVARTKLVQSGTIADIQREDEPEILSQALDGPLAPWRREAIWLRLDQLKRSEMIAASVRRGDIRTRSFDAAGRCGAAETPACCSCSNATVDGFPMATSAAG